MNTFLETYLVHHDHQHPKALSSASKIALPPSRLHRVTARQWEVLPHVHKKKHNGPVVCTQTHTFITLGS